MAARVRATTGRSQSAHSTRPARSSRPVRVNTSRERIVEIQRSRLLAAALGAIDELGYSRVTVAHIASRARVSRRTFYELFDGREDCLLAALESVVETIRVELAGAGSDGLGWRERVRTGLWAILSFLEREPVLARVVVVQALRGGPRVLERREQVLGDLARVINGGCAESARGAECPPLTAEGLVGAGFSIVYGRLLRGQQESLTGLLGGLMGMIVLPYQGPAVARREQTRVVPAVSSASSSRTAPVSVGEGGDGGRGGSDLLAGVPMRLTYRTALVLEAIASRPGVSNRVVATLADISDQGQVSKLLARLQRLGLIENAGAGHAKGAANAWVLTGKGDRVARGIRGRTGQQSDEREG